MLWLVAFILPIYLTYEIIQVIELFGVYAVGPQD